MTDINTARLSEAERALLQQRIRGRGAAPERSHLVARTHMDKSPLSVGQEQLGYFSQLAPDNPVYNEAVTIRKRGALDLDAFRAAFNEVVRRHDVWHSTFQVVEGEPLQVVSSAPAYELPVLDFGGLSTPEAEREATRMAAAEAMRPYDLERGPLLPVARRCGRAGWSAWSASPPLSSTRTSTPPSRVPRRRFGCGPFGLGLGIAARTIALNKNGTVVGTHC